MTVEAQSTPFQTDTAPVGRTIEAKQIQDLMLNGRNPLRLPMLEAGVRSGNAGPELGPAADRLQPSRPATSAAPS